MVTNQSKETEPSQQDPYGFPLDFKDWNRKTVEELARKNEIGELTDAHWRVINFVHEYYAKYGTGPPIVKIARQCDISVDEICGKLFPCGVARGAYLLAGLPRPAGCI